MGSKKKQPMETHAKIEHDTAHLIIWRGKMLAPGVYRGFCAACGTHVERSDEKQARRLDLLCRYCFEDLHPEDIGQAVRVIMEDNAARPGIGSGPLDDGSPWQDNAIGQMEDGE